MSFFENLGSRHPNTKLVVEIETDKQLLFLNVIISSFNNNLTTSGQ